MRVGRKSLEGCVPVRVNRLKEILRWDPTDKRERVRHDITDIERRTPMRWLNKM